MILSDRELKKRGLNGAVNPASIDLHLGNHIRQPRWYWKIPILRQYAFKNNWEKWGEPKPFTTYTLQPGDFVLCHSKEYANIPEDCVALLMLKSSVGRRGIEHSHAGYGDPGFKGQWTWELTNVAPWPIKLKAGEPLMQAVYAQTHIPERLYEETGRYQGQKGPTPER